MEFQELTRDKIVYRFFSLVGDNQFEANKGWKCPETCHGRYYLPDVVTQSTLENASSPGVELTVRLYIVCSHVSMVLTSNHDSMVLVSIFQSLQSRPL